MDMLQARRSQTQESAEEGAAASAKEEVGVRSLLGEIGIRALGRLMGLVLVAIAVQFVLNGLADIGFATRSG